MRLISKILLLTCMIVLIFLTSCQFGPSPTPILVLPSPTPILVLHVGDGGFLSEKPCGPPCFWSITPGITTQAEALSLLELQRVNTTECDYSQRQNPDQSEIKCGPVGLGYTLGIAIDTTGVVKDLGYKPELSFNLGDVIAKYGNPDTVSVGVLSVTLVPPDVGVQIYYDHLKAVLTLPNQKGSAEIGADIGIEDILYSNEKSYNNSRKYSQPWHGYGEYSIDP